MLAKTSERKIRSGYTLFEVLLALGIIAILLGVTVPLVSNSWSVSHSEAISESIQKALQAAHKQAMETGETRQFQITESGLLGSGDMPSVELPHGWKLQIRRFTDNRFRKPDRVEYWTINGAGICDPLELRLTGEKDSIVLRFDPLTCGFLENEN